MNNNKPFNYFFAIMPLIIGIALYKNFDKTNGNFENPTLAIVYGLTILMSLFFLFKKDTKKTSSIWLANYENNTIKVTNTWFSGEELYVNDILQDKKFGAISSDLTGHLFNSKNEKELIKANLFGWTTVKCTLFIDDKEIPVTQEK